MSPSLSLRIVPRGYQRRSVAFNNAVDTCPQSCEARTTNRKVITAFPTRGDLYILIRSLSLSREILHKPIQLSAHVSRSLIALLLVLHRVLQATSPPWSCRPRVTRHSLVRSQLTLASSFGSFSWAIHPTSGRLAHVPSSSCSCRPTA